MKSAIYAICDWKYSLIGGLKFALKCLTKAQTNITLQVPVHRAAKSHQMNKTFIIGGCKSADLWHETEQKNIK